ncbi:hypothetical protein WKK05_06005 [Nostoc sp. UHCC 0302]|uniref:hypothetical protein n=1 Tax=Nostoc sp. UHCC 0302 TaxID=3134896 RepID=UPI00311C9A47
MLGYAKTLLGYAKTLLGYAKTLLGYAKTLLGYAKTLLGYAKTLLGYAKTLLGYAKTFTCIVNASVCNKLTHPFFNLAILVFLASLPFLLPFSSGFYLKKTQYTFILFYTSLINDCNTSLGEDAIHRVSTNGLFVTFFFEIGIICFLSLRVIQESTRIPIRLGFDF